ncbi:MAG: helix-turn-helix transcriptional regulator [Olsenella sp.]|jgi:predicted transcriptional regulator YheO|nr:helix-turn-helix transcriptional regulator [Olsenella sp.]MCI1646584.1 helix-turn-helix transcriptional regulator [Olsenella sp.]MCI1793516.1 helix-turn-helix transcriptional regulator [Olsenella sp.]MCI1811279.1 helix-turn-helix transcriptional regulator [Olsenella sp.]MCI2188321.1 helix-turn-helix transcriptional regulator [Olsenella sp.]
MKKSEIEFLSRLAKGIAAQFGSNCEVVVHDLESEDPDSTIVAIENGQVTGRKLGDGPSNVVLKALSSDPSKLKDHFAYHTRTEDGRELRSSTVFFRDDSGRPVAIFAINYDSTPIMALQNMLKDFTSLATPATDEPDVIPHNVNDLLDELIDQSVRVVGKPVALMTRDDKVKAIGFLNDSGAFLITKAGQKVCNYFGISKYTLYSYMDEAKAQKKE